MEYAKAFAIVKAYNINRGKDQQAEEKVKAQELMLHMESELDIEGYMTARNKLNEILKNNTCYQISRNGGKTPC